jgi:hypothetical protein
MGMAYAFSPTTYFRRWNIAAIVGDLASYLLLQLVFV